MHVSRGSWLGQTYALAKFDDSFEGKKSGNRRSKKERKGMVETFIKRYQKSNNGDFPSLNLTRKEVGGSFYTVREIVREIIQENRVLGPPKSPPGDRNMENLDSFLEQNPLGSMSVDDLHVHIVHPNETQTVEESMGEQKDKVNGVVTNQSQKHQILEDVVGGDSSLGIVTNTIHKMEEKAIEIRELASEVVDIQLEEETTHRVTQSTPTLASDHKNQNHSSSEENIVLDVSVDRNKLEDSLPAEEKQTINGDNNQNLHTNSVQESTFDETSANLNKSVDHSSSISQKRRTTPTLNRINLESWEAASKKSSHQETHRFVTFVKSFITAFVKFWSE